MIDKYLVHASFIQFVSGSTELHCFTSMYLTNANELQNVVLLCDYSASNSPQLKF